MRRHIPQILAVCAAVVWAALWWLTGLGADVSSSRQPGVPRPATSKHYVTPAQLIESGAVADRKVRSFSAVARRDGIHVVRHEQGAAACLGLHPAGLPMSRISNLSSTGWPADTATSPNSPA